MPGITLAGMSCRRQISQLLGHEQTGPAGPDEDRLDPVHGGQSGAATLLVTSLGHEAPHGADAGDADEHPRKVDQRDADREPDVLEEAEARLEVPGDDADGQEDECGAGGGDEDAGRLTQPDVSPLIAVNAEQHQRKVLDRHDVQPHDEDAKDHPLRWTPVETQEQCCPKGERQDGEVDDDLGGPVEELDHVVPEGCASTSSRPRGCEEGRRIIARSREARASWHGAGTGADGCR